MRKTLLGLLVTLLVAGAAMAADTRAAQTSADAFLKLVDAGKYDQAYNGCSAFLKKSAAKAAFVGPIQTTRKKLGAVTSRKFKSATPITDPPGAPKGSYVMLIYSTDFANQKGLNEVVTPMKEADGTWRVSGYYIRPGK